MTKDLKHIYTKFPTQKDCIVYLENLRWSNDVKCPYCFQSNYIAYKNENRYHCNNCETSFSVTVKTAFHKTKLDLQKWLYAVGIVVNSNGKVTSRQLGIDIGATKDTALRMLHKIREHFTTDKDLFLTIANDLRQLYEQP